ncbi:hypothetical protein MHU86_13724 [Fragilaria crotonensis]|nr:hypothetical protein MHU86_13724 [Fragilaria crotonensis]
MDLDYELIQYAGDGNLDRVRDLLRRGANVNATSPGFGNTALIMASYNRHSEVVGELLNHEVDVNIQDNDGRTALICASDNDDWDLVDMLLDDEGVDVNIQDNNGRTALIYASDNGHLSVLWLLLDDEGVDVNIQDNDGKTALIYACDNGDVIPVRDLLYHDEVNVKTTMAEQLSSMQAIMTIRMWFIIYCYLEVWR